MQDPAIVASFVDEVEAAAEANLLDQAEEALAAARGLRSQPTWGPPLVIRADAVLAARRGRLDEAESTLAGALGAWTLPLQRGRTLLALGSVQRRLRRRAVARETLQEALATFEELGAQLWAERAREELGRIGGRRAVAGELTPSERRITELVAGGKTNKEVAAVLFVADRTVESALTQIYRKLGVRSRTELARKLGNTLSPSGSPHREGRQEGGRDGDHHRAADAQGRASDARGGCLVRAFPSWNARSMFADIKPNSRRAASDPTKRGTSPWKAASPAGVVM
jgi:DNA-binding CsgD family transcriptional regulator